MQIFRKKVTCNGRIGFDILFCNIRKTSKITTIRKLFQFQCVSVKKKTLLKSVTFFANIVFIQSRKHFFLLNYAIINVKVLQNR